MHKWLTNLSFTFQVKQHIHFHIALSMLKVTGRKALLTFAVSILWVGGIKLLKLVPIGHMNQSERSLKLYLRAINKNVLNIQQIWAAGI